MNTSKNLITRSAFEEFCNGPFSAALQVLSINMASSNQKLKQSASRALGYSCYEQLLAGWQRVEHIKHGLFFEYCEIRKAMTIKAKNILMVFDLANNQLIAVSLRPGEEGRAVAIVSDVNDDDSLIEDNWEAAQLQLPDSAAFNFESIAKTMRCSVDLSLTTSPTETIRAPIEFEYRDEHGHVKHGFIEMQRTGEGVIADLYLTMNGDECVDSIGVMFEDRQEAIEGSNKVQLHLNYPVFDVSYKWLQPSSDCADDEEGDARLLYINPDEEFCISSLEFSSTQEAIHAIESNDWCHNRHLMSAYGAVLVKVTREVVPSPY